MGLQTAPSSAPAPEVDVHQGDSRPTGRMVDPVDARHPATTLAMPPLSQFKKLDVRPLLQKGREPLPEILKRVHELKADQGLIVIAPFLPSPLIEKLGSEGYQFKLEPGQGGHWIVYFWPAA
jgi:uncharacterized protein (DUF2249 family)